MCIYERKPFFPSTIIPLFVERVKHHSCFTTIVFFFYYIIYYEIHSGLFFADFELIKEISKKKKWKRKKVNCEIVRVMHTERNMFLIDLTSNVDLNEQRVLLPKYFNKVMTATVLRLL